ncbi:MAG: transcriptional regulator [Dehalococcoidales bacterium]|jgi:DNA-binding transcriptional regulator YiaG|nr:transcriptional regulator [Dehalococcoidales bacterium]MDP7110105.1 helix-turn-helix domain-containing protein [Dehalococcoidales bacterium]MDP7309643.1 helix-turn-helix domain-containing protein [Dehalococcoidales bacterium]MDP7675759.1 helix-turn-helix domain-containing protein [Dehalococcoidales bacterium]|tara:strand:+ start:341 stop:565 length:225 start_codon:yes stop_codon:yes gene_type:complete
MNTALKEKEMKKIDAQEIIRKRHEMNLTQEEFAHKLGVTMATLQRWEMGKHTPSPMAARLLRKVISTKVLKDRG